MTDLEKVQQDGFSIQYIKNPTEEVKLAAARKNGHNIIFTGKTV